MNVLNPKTALFFFAFLPQFVDPEQGSPTLQIGVLGLVFVLLAVLSDSVWALAAGTASSICGGAGASSPCSATSQAPFSSASACSRPRRNVTRKGGGADRRAS